MPSSALSTSAKNDLLCARSKSLLQVCVSLPIRGRLVCYWAAFYLCTLSGVRDTKQLGIWRRSSPISVTLYPPYLMRTLLLVSIMPLRSKVMLTHVKAVSNASARLDPEANEPSVCCASLGAILVFQPLPIGAPSLTLAMKHPQKQVNDADEDP